MGQIRGSEPIYYGLDLTGPDSTLRAFYNRRETPFAVAESEKVIPIPSRVHLPSTDERDMFGDVWAKS